MTDSGSYSRSQAASIPFFTAAMFLVGMQMAETGAALDHMARSLSLDSSEQGLLVSLRFVGGLVVGLFLWAGHARVRFSGALAVALGLVVLSGPLLFVESYAAALAIAGLRGLAMGTVIPLSGMFSAAQEMKPTGQVAAGVNAALSAGMVVLSLVATVFAATIGVGWQAYWAAASIMALLMLILLPFVAFPPVPERGEDRPREQGASSFARAGRLRGIIVYLTQLTQGTTWSFAAAGLLLVGSEAVLLGLIPALTVRVAGGRFGGELLALLLMTGVLIGRVAGTVLFKRFTTMQVVTVSAVTVVVAALIWGLVSPLAPAMLVMLGVATGNLFPGMIAHISHARPSEASATIASIGWTGGLGGTVVPALAGAALGSGVPPRWVSLFVIVPTLGAYLLARRGGAAPSST